MRTQQTSTIPLVIFAVALSGQCMSAQSVLDGRVQFIQWARQIAQPLPHANSGGMQMEGTDWIVRLARNAEILGIGESMHDAHEFLQLRALVTKTLIERGRLSAIVLETSFAEAATIDAWLAGREPIQPDLEQLLSFGFGRESEIVQTLQWIREYNSRHKPNHQVHFYGADLPSDGGGSLEPALKPVWSYLAAVDPEFAVGASARIEPITRQLDTRGYDIVGRYGALSSATRDSLHRALDEVAATFTAQKKIYLRKSSAAEFARVERLLVIARQTEKAVRVGWNDTTNPRDQAMASNIQWIAARERRRGLIVVWAHNLHIARVPIGGPVFEARGPAVRSMGQYLQQDFGDRYVAVGTAFRTGPDSRTPKPASVDATLSEVGKKRFGVELKRAPPRGEVAAWLNQPHLMRAEDGYVTVPLAQAFDAIFFLDSVRSSDHVGAKVESPNN
jgi:erythromycin esterase